MTAKRELERFLAKYEPGDSGEGKEGTGEDEKAGAGRSGAGVRQLQLAGDRVWAERESVTGSVFNRSCAAMGDAVLLAGGVTAGSCEAVERKRERGAECETGAAFGFGRTRDSGIHQCSDEPGKGGDRPEAEAEDGHQICFEETAAAKAERQRSSVGMTDITP